MTSAKMNNNIFEALFRQAVIDNFEDEVNAIPPNDVLAGMYEFSDRHKNAMKRIFKAEKRQDRLKVILKIGKAAAVIAVITITAFFTMLMTSPEVRAAVGRTIVEWYEKFTKFSSVSIEETTVEREWEITYIPDGYAFSETMGTLDNRIIRYKNAENEYITLVCNYNISLSFDNEDLKYSEIISNGILYYYFESEGSDKYNSVAWINKGYAFNLTGVVPVDELLNIAYSAK